MHNEVIDLHYVQEYRCDNFLNRKNYNCFDQFMRLSDQLISMEASI